MYVRVVGFGENGEVKTSFQGELDRHTFGAVVASCARAAGVAWVSATVGAHAEKHYWVEPNLSWRRVW